MISFFVLVLFLQLPTATITVSADSELLAKADWGFRAPNHRVHGSKTRTNQLCQNLAAPRSTKAKLQGCNHASTVVCCPKPRPARIVRLTRRRHWLHHALDARTVMNGMLWVRTAMNTMLVLAPSMSSALIPGHRSCSAVLSWLRVALAGSHEFTIRTAVCERNKKRKRTRTKRGNQRATTREHPCRASHRRSTRAEATPPCMRAPRWPLYPCHATPQRLLHTLAPCQDNYAEPSSTHQAASVPSQGHRASTLATDGPASHSCAFCCAELPADHSPFMIHGRQHYQGREEKKREEEAEEMRDKKNKKKKSKEKTK